MPLLIYPN